MRLSRKTVGAGARDSTCQPGHPGQDEEPQIEDLVDTDFSEEFSCDSRV